MTYDAFNQVNTLSTSCKKCAFAHYIGKTQVSCDLNRIEHFTKNDIEVIEAEDHDKEFYVIDGVCTGYRLGSWSELHAGKDLVKVYEEETIPKIGFMIQIEEPKDKDEIFADISKTVKSIHDGLKYPPGYFIVVNNLLNAQLSPLDLLQEAQDIFSEGTDYKIMKVTTETSTSFDRIDVGFLNVKNGFYCVLKAGDTIIHNMDEILSHAINMQLLNIGMVKSKDEVSMMTVHSVLHKHLHGNLEDTLELKIKNIQNEDGAKASLVYTWDELSDVFTKSNNTYR